MITGLRPESFQKLQLNAGIFLAGFDFASAKDAAAVKTAVALSVRRTSAPSRRTASDTSSRAARSTTAGR